MKIHVFLRVFMVHSLPVVWFFSKKRRFFRIETLSDVCCQTMTINLIWAYYRSKQAWLRFIYQSGHLEFQRFLYFFFEVFEIDDYGQLVRLMVSPIIVFVTSDGFYRYLLHMHLYLVFSVEFRKFSVFKRSRLVWDWYKCTGCFLIRSINWKNCECGQ